LLALFTPGSGVDVGVIPESDCRPARPDQAPRQRLGHWLPGGPPSHRAAGFRPLSAVGPALCPPTAFLEPSSALPAGALALWPRTLCSLFGSRTLGDRMPD